MAEPTTPMPAPTPAAPRRTGDTAVADAGATPAASDGPAQTSPTPPERGRTAVCRHCGQPLFTDPLWGWMHGGSRYLCQDPATGEPLCQPATPA